MSEHGVCVLVGMGRYRERNLYQLSWLMRQGKWVQFPYAPPSCISMKKPSEPFLPIEFAFQPKTKVVVLAQKLFSLDEYINNFDDFRDQYDERCHLIDSCTFHKFSYEEDFFSLEEILRVSQGLPFESIRITLERDREISFVIASVICETPYSEAELTDWEKASLAAKAKYQKEFAVYQEELKQFHISMLEKQIEETKTRLEKMKK